MQEKLNLTTNPTPEEISEEYLELIAQAIVNWTDSELKELATPEGFAVDGRAVMDGVTFIKLLIRKIPAIGGLCLQAGAVDHLPTDVHDDSLVPDNIHDYKPLSETFVRLGKDNRDCGDCRKLNRNHPFVMEYISTDNKPWLKRLCDGRLFRLV